MAVNPRSKGALHQTKSGQEPTSQPARTQLFDQSNNHLTTYRVFAKVFRFSGTRQSAHSAAVAAPPTASLSRHRSRETTPPTTTGDTGVGRAHRQTRENARAARSRRRGLLGLEEGPGRAQSRITCWFCTVTVLIAACFFVVVFFALINYPKNLLREGVIAAFFVGKEAGREGGEGRGGVASDSGKQTAITS